jgi:glucose/arabinose dehydrogenase
MKKPFLAACCIALAGWEVSGALVDTNFSETLYASAGEQVTGMAWAPDGSSRLFISLKDGAIVIIKNGSLQAQPFAVMSPIVTGGESGLIGMCFDPNFLSNGFVYAFVTVSNSEQQILRLTAVGDIGTDRTVIIPGLPTLGGIHNGGAVGIGADGKLYWGVGDNGNGRGVDNDLTSLASKVGRANLDGSLPWDNPFADGPGGNNDYIWARGFRNPFTFEFQPNTGDLWVNCVGTSYEQIFLVRARDHAGWNDYENNQPPGYITPKIKYRTNGTDTRNLVPNGGAVRSGNIVTFTTTGSHGFRQGEKITVTGTADATFNGSFYVSAVPTATSFNVSQTGTDASSGGGVARTLDQGGAVTGGCFWNSTAVPEAYRGNYFYGDLNSGRIMRAALNGANEVTSVDYFLTSNGQLIDTSVGPDGALYYLDYSGNVSRVAWTNDTVQRLVVTPNILRIVETGSGVLMVRLATAPETEVTVEVAQSAGDSRLQVLSGNQLVFTPENWSVPQKVLISCTEDPRLQGNATAQFNVSGNGVDAETITVHAVGTVFRPMVGPISRVGNAPFPVQIGMSGQPGMTYVLEAAASLGTGWTPISTNLLQIPLTNIVDSTSGNSPQRFYRSRSLISP